MPIFRKSLERQIADLCERTNETRRSPAVPVPWYGVSPPSHAIWWVTETGRGCRMATALLCLPAFALLRWTPYTGATRRKRRDRPCCGRGLWRPMLSALSGAPISTVSSPVAVLTSTPLCTSAPHPLGRKRSRSVISSRNEPTPGLLQAPFRRGRGEVFVDLAAFARPCDTSLRLLTRSSNTDNTETDTHGEKRDALP